MKLSNRYNPYTAVGTAKHKTTEHCPSNYAQNFSFGSLYKQNGKFNQYFQVNDIIKTIDGVIGKNTNAKLAYKDGFLASKIDELGIDISQNVITFKAHTLLGDIFSTLKYPFVDMPFDLANALCKNLRKTPFSNLADKISNNPSISEGIKRVQYQRNYELVESIFDQFVRKDTDNVETLGKIFEKSTSEKITKTAKNYASRDERTLNRFVTGSVGAILSGVDMYNISMLEKNDKNSAKKAGKDRREQEMTRIGLSSALTFLSLGALARYTKHSVLLSAFVVAGSALAAEIYSRIRKHRPLIPLSPEMAKEYVRKNSGKKPDAPSNSVEVAMKRINKTDKNNLYKDFTHNQISTTGSIIEEKAQKKEKKNNHTLRKIGYGVIFASLLYVATRASKGDYLKLMKQKPLYEANKEILDRFAEGKSNKLTPELLQKIDDINEIKTSFNFTKWLENNVKSKIVDKDVEIDTNKLAQELKTLLEKPEAKDISPVIQKYLDHLEIVKEAKIKDDKLIDGVYSDKVQKTISGAIYAGVTKLFKTFYTILSIPAFSIDKLIFGKTEKAFKEVEKMRGCFDNSRFAKDYQKEIGELFKTFDKYKDHEDKYQKIAKTIEKHARNFEESSETGDLANLSRTMVTLISSWFYVNDFRNTVLIESEGKNIERAREVTNDSIGFKICNFFFNGTLMNLANSLFKDLLNRSLIGATLIATGSEITNEFLIRKTIARPMRKMNSRDELIEYERVRRDRKGPLGAWTRFFKKVTGQKSLVEKYNAQQANKK